MQDLLEIENEIENINYKECSFIDKLPLAYAYVPYQTFEGTYSVSESLKKGTAFPELYKPESVYGNEFLNGGGNKNDR